MNYVRRSSGQKMYDHACILFLSPSLIILIIWRGISYASLSPLSSFYILSPLIFLFFPTIFHFASVFFFHFFTFSFPLCFSSYVFSPLIYFLLFYFFHLADNQHARVRVHGRGLTGVRERMGKR